MKTKWDDKRISDLFNAYDDFVENLLGYQPLIEQLRRTYPSDAAILDYGCGGGKVVRRLVDTGFSNISGVDLSPDMVEKARSSHLGAATFHVIDESGDAIPEKEFDVVLMCFVLINTDTKEALRRIISNVFARLKPGGKLFILESNPRVTGVNFTTFRSGMPNIEYKDGDLREVHLQIPGQKDPLILWDRHWCIETYIDILHHAGFEGPTIYEATAEILFPPSRVRLKGNEGRHPPFIRMTAMKP